MLVWSLSFFAMKHYISDKNGLGRRPAADDLAEPDELFGDLGGDIIDRGCTVRLADCISAQHVCDGDGHPTLRIGVEHDGLGEGSHNICRQQRERR